METLLVFSFKAIFNSMLLALRPRSALEAEIRSSKSLNRIISSLVAVAEKLCKLSSVSSI
jgi:hypothetical protein